MPTKTSKLKITRSEPVFHGTKGDGTPYTIYEIDALRVNDDGTEGDKVDAKLRSFAPLPVTQIVEVTVTRYRNDRTNEESFTLAPVQGHANSSTTNQINELRDNLEEAFRRIARLTEQVGDLSSRVGELMRSEPSAPGATSPTTPGSQFGDQPPY